MFVWKKYVYEVYKERSFTKAAQNLYISQPSLSARIKKIEEIIGEPLFDRSTTPLQLTEVGKVYIEAAEEITQIEQRVENYINDLAGLKTGNLAVGASTLFAAYVVKFALITQFNQKFPDAYSADRGNTAELEEMLGSNALDFVIDNYHYDSILYNKELYCEENILLAVPKHFAVNEELGMYQLYKNIKIKLPEQKYPAVPLGRFADLPLLC
ncbi:MAG: LysR family transcriptional regulator [Dorea sp.]